MSEQWRNSSPSVTYAPQVHVSNLQRYAKEPIRTLTSFRPLGNPEKKETHLCLAGDSTHSTFGRRCGALGFFTLDKWFALSVVLSLERSKADLDALYSIRDDVLTQHWHWN